MLLVNDQGEICNSKNGHIIGDAPLFRVPSDRSRQWLTTLDGRVYHSGTDRFITDQEGNTLTGMVEVIVDDYCGSVFCLGDNGELWKLVGSNSRKVIGRVAGVRSTVFGRTMVLHNESRRWVLLKDWIDGDDGDRPFDRDHVSKEMRYEIISVDNDVPFQQMTQLDSGLFYRDGYLYIACGRYNLAFYRIDIPELLDAKIDASIESLFILTKDMKLMIIPNIDDNLWCNPDIESDTCNSELVQLIDQVHGVKGFVKISGTINLLCSNGKVFEMTQTGALIGSEIHPSAFSKPPSMVKSART